MISILVVIITLALTSYISFGSGKDEIEETLGVNTKINIESATPKPTEESSPQPTSSEEPSTAPTSEPTQTPIPSQTNSSNIDEWIYPGANITSKSSNSLSLETGESAEVVTNWYKDKVRSGGFNAKSFVSTKTNDNVLNKLSGAKSGQEVAVEIKKVPGETSTKITVTLE